jgi:xanthine dehydrogenase large subunit
VMHSTASYFVPNVRVFGVCCRTNLPPMTAFRGFGGPQGMFVMECAVAEAATALGTSREALQALNLLSEGDVMPYGQVAEDCRARRCFEAVEQAFDLPATRRRIAAWNAAHPRYKKGYALMPVCFGISFTATFMNQAGALLHVYTDGSVAVSTGGVEMGQGLSTNIVTIVSRALGISPHRVRFESTHTRRIANMSASAASATTLLNGNAALGAARRVLNGLLANAAQALGVGADRLEWVDEALQLDGRATDWDWERLVMAAYRARVPLSAHEFYATPDIWFDAARRQGRPFAYFVYGTALVEVTVDGLLGTYTVDAVRLVHDLGRPLNERIDRGQVEGGLAQGLGWMTLEDLRYDATGRIRSGALATYKVPDVYFMPRDLDVRFLADAGCELGPYHSKAVGEPPLMYGIGVFFALRQALAALRPDVELPFDAPLTPEKVMLHLHGTRLAELEEAARRPAVMPMLP